MRRAIGAVLAVALAACGGAQNEGAAEGDPLDAVTGEQLYRRGVALASGGDFVRAEQYLAASIERGYPEERAIPALMHVCVQADRLVAALEYAEPYLSRHPTEWTLRMLVASIHLGLQHHEQARDQLRRVLEDAPEEPPQAHYLLGVLHRDNLDDLESARAHFRRYLALAPQGDHRDEALASLDPEERGAPRRVPMPTADDGEGDEAVAEGADPSDESDAEASSGGQAPPAESPAPSDPEVTP